MIQHAQGPQFSPHLPEGTQQAQAATKIPASFTEGGEGVNKAALSTWGKMFGGAATEKELKQIMNLAIKSLLDQMKKEQAKALEAIKKMRREQEEGLS